MVTLLRNTTLLRETMTMRFLFGNFLCHWYFYSMQIFSHRSSLVILAASCAHTLLSSNIWLMMNGESAAPVARRNHEIRLNSSRQSTNGRRRWQIRQILNELLANWPRAWSQFRWLINFSWKSIEHGQADESTHSAKSYFCHSTVSSKAE